MQDENQQKRALIEALLPSCPFVELMAHDADVLLPDVLKTHPKVVLRLGRTPGIMNMPDLVFTEQDFSATVSVRGALYAVRIPWTAVLRIWTTAGDMQDSVVTLSGWQRWFTGKSDQPEAPAPEPKRPQLRIVKSD